MLKVITVTSSPEHAVPLVKSLIKHGWSFHVIECEWKGFGTKIIETYNYLKQHPEVTEFIFCDAFDVVVLGGEDEFRNKLFITDTLLLSCERGLWPPNLIPFRAEYAKLYHGFNYINSGLYYSKSEYFIELFEKYPPFYEVDDQHWLNLCFLLGSDNGLGYMRADYNQSIFNSHSFIGEGEYTYNNNRVQIFDSEPIFIHFNGRSVDEKFNELIKL